MGFSLRPETYDAIINREQTTVFELSEGEKQSVDTQLNKMTEDLRQWKFAQPRKVQKSKTIIRKIKKLAQLEAVYPPELLAARRAEFVARVQKFNNRDSG